MDKDKKDLDILNNNMMKDTGVYEYTLLNPNSEQAQKAHIYLTTSINPEISPESAKKQLWEENLSLLEADF